MDYQTIKYTQEEGIGTLTLNRPGQLNALSHVMFDELIELLRKLEMEESLRVLIIRGEGRAFSAGGDVVEMQEGYGGNMGFYDHMESANRFTIALAEFPKPVIAVVQGAATGAGMNIALASDIAIASEKAKFSEIFGNVGLVPDVGGTYFLPRLVGRAKAKELIFTYKIIDAKEAGELGIVNRVVSEEELEGVVEEYAKRIAAGPTRALGIAKKLINRSFEIDLKTALDFEGMAQALCGNAEEHREGVQAFSEKRKPNFKDM